MKSAVVFGGCGFIGLYYADKALDLNLFDKLYLVDLKEPEDIFCKSKFKKLLSSGKIEFLKRDVRENLNNLSLAENPDTIVNLAAVHKEPGHEYHEYGETNIKGAENICNFAKFYNCNNIIFTSSIAVYGIGEHEKSETTAPNPSTAYGKSKLSAEKVHLNWQKESPHNILSICRPGVVFGAGEKGNVTRLIKFIKKKLFFYMGNKKLKKGGIYIKELINMLIWVDQKQLNKKIENLVIYNACFYPCLTLENYAKSISKKLNYSNNFISIPDILIKFFLFLSLVYTKVLKKNDAFNYYRLKKLFRSNTIAPFYLVDKKYNFKYDLDSSFDDWEKINPQDWL